MKAGGQRQRPTPRADSTDHSHFYDDLDLSRQDIFPILYRSIMNNNSSCFSGRSASYINNTCFLGLIRSSYQKHMFPGFDTYVVPYAHMSILHNLSQFTTEGEGLGDPLRLETAVPFGGRIT